MDKYLKGNELYFTAKCSARCSLPDASNPLPLAPSGRCVSLCLRAFGELDIVALGVLR